VYGPHGRVTGNARIRGEAWVLGRVDGDAEICDLVVVEAHAYIGGPTVLSGDEIVGGARPAMARRRAAGRAMGASWVTRNML
jgi:hypothetical protein